MNYSMQHIQKSLKNLSRLKPAHPKMQGKMQLSLKDTILFMAPKLLAMKEQGFSTKELSQALAAQDIVIKAATLNRYLCQYQRKHALTVESKTVAEVMPVNLEGELSSSTSLEEQRHTILFAPKSAEPSSAGPHEV